MSEHGLPVVTEEMVERLKDYLQREWAGPYYASVSEYVTTDHPGPERDAQIKALQEADKQAEATAWAAARRALEVALGYD